MSSNENQVIKESITKIIDFLILKQQSNQEQYMMLNEMPPFPINKEEAELYHNKFLKLHKDSLNAERFILNNLAILKEKLTEVSK